MKPKSIEKRAAVRSAVLSTLFQVMAAGGPLYLRAPPPPGRPGGGVVVFGRVRPGPPSLPLRRPAAAGAGDRGRGAG